MFAEALVRSMPMKQDLPDLFDGLNGVDAHTALRRFTERTLEPGEVLFETGAPANELICVLDGALTVRSGNTQVGAATAGDLVGEMSLFEEGTRTATVLAGAPTRVLELSRTGYEELRDVLHPIVQNIERAALDLQIERVRSVGDRIATLSKGSRSTRYRPTQRFFNNLAAMFGRGGTLSTDRVTPLEALRQSALFADVPEGPLEEIAQRFSTTVCGAGHVLCTEGQRGKSMYVLEEGEVEVIVSTGEDRVQSLATLEPGAAFGTISLAQQAPRAATCVAKTRCVLLKLDRESFQELLADSSFAGSAFRRAILREHGENLRYANTQLAGLGENTALEDLPLQRARARMSG